MIEIAIGYVLLINLFAFSLFGIDKSEKDMAHSGSDPSDGGGAWRSRGASWNVYLSSQDKKTEILCWCAGITCGRMFGAMVFMGKSILIFDVMDGLNNKGQGRYRSSFLYKR